VAVSLSTTSGALLDLGVEGVLDSALPSAIAPTIYARCGDIPAAVIVAAAMIFVIRRRAANQFRKSGMALISQPVFARIR
jgi:apolipoprotein N-acyltransferase